MDIDGKSTGEIAGQLEGRAGPLRVYRSWSSIVAVSVLGAVMIIVALAMVASPGMVGVSGVVMGVIAAVASVYVIWRGVRTRVEVSAERIVSYGSGFGKKVIPWTAVAAIEVARRDLVTPWYVLEVVTTEHRRIQLVAAAGLKKHVEGIAADLQSLCHQ